MQLKRSLILLILGLLLVLIVFSGCSKIEEEDKQIIEPQPLTAEQFASQERSYSCTVDDVEYFVYRKLMYHLDDKGRAHITIKDGSYIQKDDKTGWTFKRALNPESAFYRHLEQAILTGKTDWDSPAVCKTIEKIPENFAVFVVNHPFVFQKYV